MKTYLSIQLILALKKQKENIKVIVSVPSTNLKDQWDEYRIKNGLMNNMEIWVINSLVKEEHICDLLIVDKKFVELKFTKLLGNILYYQHLRFLFTDLIDIYNGKDIIF